MITASVAPRNSTTNRTKNKPTVNATASAYVVLIAHAGLIARVVRIIRQLDVDALKDVNVIMIALVEPIVGAVLSFYLMINASVKRDVFVGQIANVHQDVGAVLKIK